MSSCTNLVIALSNSISTFAGLIAVTGFDHNLIISEAQRAMRLYIEHYPIGYNLLPEKFTGPDLHSLYETILGKTLDYRNFSKRIFALGIVEKLQETKSIGAHRSPFLYRFNKEKYEKGLETAF
ncbi:hypothetical protein SNE26_17840 [Mucilaginibacter sp. cycad4]|uniref:NUDIX hydrolase n=1 Tax=Mucilaginibacter sp. cycad4 TaxID=3342096 RepID=UPI002AAAF0E3|nr:hypothetical protein [Mucilaginibacter gossypii]WPU97891.1 hypothetical protein SNE26_17840 [Mucilaginibacter gossypii]